MKCPACNLPLKEFGAGVFNVDICRDGCAGIWFDKSEFEKCDEHNEPFPEELLRVRRNADVAIDRNKKRACPKCTGQTLTRKVLDTETRFEIDECPGCGGHWLDIGELQKIRSTDKTDKEMNVRIAAFEKKVEEQLKSDKNSRLRAFVELIMR